jgi:predicted transposase/invertase (TIGR01784 family)
MTLTSRLHNSFFLKTFKDHVNTKDFMRATLPPQIVEKINFDSVQFESTGFVDDSLSEHLSDLVVKMETMNGDENIDLYLLFEHKSYIDRNILWQLLKYQYMMLEEDHKEKRNFRMIIPFVFYHGHGKWNISRTLTGAMNVPEEMKKYLLDFEYLLYDTKDFDLSQEEKFCRNVYLMSAMSLLKEHRTMNLEKFRSFARYLRESGLAKETDTIRLLFRYYIYTNEVEEIEVVNIIKEEFGDEAEDIMPSLGKKIFNEGKEAGREEGREEGAFLKAIETCKNALRSGLSPEMVSKITNLPLERVLEIEESLRQ